MDVPRLVGRLAEPLPEVHDVLVEVDHLLALCFCQVDATLFKVEQEQSGYVVVHRAGAHYITVLNSALQGFVKFCVSVESVKFPSYRR